MTDDAARADEPRCEVCGADLEPWVLGPGDVLDRCTDCGHVARDLTRAPAGHRSAAWGGGDDMDAVRLALTYRRLRRLAVPSGPSRPLRVFDAGFGSGGLLRRFLDDGAHVGGADPGALERDVDPRVVEQAALTRGPVEDVREGLGSYDLVLAVHVVEHVADPHGFVRACAALARPVGVVAVLTPAGDSTGLERYGADWWMLEDPTHARFFSQLSLALLLSRCGLSDVRVTRPVTDSLAVEAASWSRAHRAPGQAGVLADPRSRGAVVVSLPVVLPVRALVPRRRPTLLAVASRP